MGTCNAMLIGSFQVTAITCGPKARNGWPIAGNSTRSLIIWRVMISNKQPEGCTPIRDID
jgi:hypothetical protein